MPTPNEQELLNKSELPVQNPSKPPIAESSNVPGTELSPEEIDIPVGEVLPSEESTSQERKEVSLEGQAAVVKESLDSIKGGFVNWKQGILDSQLFSAEELPGVEQWFSDSLNRFKSIEQIIISELSVLQVLREGYSEQSKEIQKISERLLTVNKFVKEQQEKITSLLASLRLISEGLSQNPQAAKDNVVSSMKIVFKAMNDLSRKYLAGMDKQGLLRDLRESELLEKANNPEQFSTKLEEKKANLNLLYNCYNQASFSEIEKAFVFADVYFEKESMFLTAQENETLQSLLLANSDLEKTRIGKDGQLKPVIPDNLRQFYTLRAALEDSAEKYQILGANFSAMEFVDQILKDKKISALDNYDLQHYTLGAFQSQIGRLLSENKATEIPAYLQKNLNDLTNILSALLKLPVSDVSNYLKTNPAELRKIILEASGGVSGEVELTGAEDFPVPKTESVVLDDVMDADDLLEEVTTPDAKPKYSMPPLPAMETVKQAMSASEKTQLLENFWKAEDTFKQVVSRKVELGVSSDLKMIDNIKNTLIENGILEVGGVSLSSPEFTIDVNTLQTELWEGINNLIVSGLESKKEFSEIESEINKYISQKRAELVLLKEKLQKAITPFIEFRKKHPDVEQLMEANINSKLVSKVNAIANLVKNQFLKSGIEEVDGINLLALSEIYDGGEATMEFKNKVKSIIEEELAKGSSPDEVFVALNKFISQTDDKLRNLYKLLLENVPGRVVDRESQLVADFWKNQPALANRVSYYETMFAELQKSAQEKAGESVLDDMSKNFRDNLNQSLRDALSQQKTEAEIVKWLETEFKHADEIIDKLSVDVLLKKDKPQPVEEGGGDEVMNADDLLEEVTTFDAKPKYSMPPLPAMEAVSGKSVESKGKLKSWDELKRVLDADVIERFENKFKTLAQYEKDGEELKLFCYVGDCEKVDDWKQWVLNIFNSEEEPHFELLISMFDQRLDELAYAKKQLDLVRGGGSKDELTKNFLDYHGVLDGLWDKKGGMISLVDMVKYFKEIIPESFVDRESNIVMVGDINVNFLLDAKLLDTVVKNRINNIILNGLEQKVGERQILDSLYEYKNSLSIIGAQLQAYLGRLGSNRFDMNAFKSLMVDLTGTDKNSEIQNLLESSSEFTAPLPAMEAVKQAEQKSPEKRELSLKEMIASAKSFDELAEIIQKNQIVIQGSEKLYTTDQGSQKLYTTQDLLDSIAVAKDGKLAPNFWFAPRTHQFREKLISLSNAQRAKTSGEEMIELSDEDVEDITGKPVKATPPPLPPHIQKLQEEARKQKEMAEKAQVEAEPISLTEDMKKKPIDETKQTPDMATWLSEPIVGPHERMLGVSRLIKDLIKTGKYVDEKRLLIDIDNKFNRLAENLDNPETITAWEQFQAENNVEIEDPLVYFVDKVLDLNGIKAAYDSKNGFEFRNAVDIANLKVSNFMNALNLSEDYLPVPTRRSSVDARASLKRGGGIKVQMPGSL
ncbi:MAG TPA: hypothetical protein PL066_01930 [bacterium]|nr:hypothetical protein [bacterium]